MALCKMAVFLMLFSLVLVVLRADDAVSDETSGGGSDSSLQAELEQLKSKVSVLEKSIEYGKRELESKVERIGQLESIIQERSDGIASLQQEIEALQKKGTVAAEEQVGKAYARTRELEKQVEQLSKEVEAHSSQEDFLQTRANEADKKVSELSAKLEKLQKVSEEQKTRIRITERALQSAEEEMMKAKLDAKSRAGELRKIHGAWLPPWLASHVVGFQSFAAQHWHEHGKPAFDVALKKAVEKSEQTKKWIEPHLDTVKTKWIPSLKEHILTHKTSADPYIQSVTARTLEAFKTSKSVVIPYIIQVREKTVPYIKEAKRVSKPYVDQIAASAKPHVEKARIVLKPYKNKVVRHFRTYWKSVAVYHHQTQKNVQKYLKKHEVTKPMASKEMAWFTASALFAVPIFFLYTIVSSLFSKTVRKPVTSAHSGDVHRKRKRRHVEK